MMQLTAGDKFALKVQLRDDFGNNAPLTPLMAATSPASMQALRAGAGVPQLVFGASSANASAADAKATTATIEEVDSGELTASLETPDGTQALAIRKVHPEEEAAKGARSREAKKASGPTSGGMVGLYEVVSLGELARKGEHVASVFLRGASIRGVPVRFHVRPANPFAAKSWLEVRPRSMPVVHTPTEVVLHLVDKYGNDVETGGVRVDSKIFGSKASECQVVDCGDGTYTLTFVASVPGEYKVSARLENIEITPVQVHVGQNHDFGQAPGTAPAPSSQPRGDLPEDHLKQSLGHEAQEDSTRSVTPSAAAPAVSITSRPVSKKKGTPSKSSARKKRASSPVKKKKGKQ